MFGRKNRFGDRPDSSSRREGINSAEDVCVCPSCGYTVEHERGVPCNSLLCPTCNINLVRKIIFDIPEKTGPMKDNDLKSKKPYPKVDTELCMGCGECEVICPTSAISIVNDVAFINEDKCKKCQLCVTVCPAEAIK